MRYLERNFISNALSGLAAKMADQLMNPGIVLPFLFSAMSIPSAITGLLVPVRQAGATLPQIFFANTVKRFPVRKWVWVLATFGQAAAVLLMAVSAVLFKGIIGGVLVVLALLLFSVIKAFSSISFKDTLAKTIEKGRRGRLMSARAALGGIATLAAGLFFRFYVTGGSYLVYAYILFASASFWFIAAALFAAIDEKKDYPRLSDSTLEDVKLGLGLLWSHVHFRRFMIGRSLLATVNLYIPFFILLFSSISANSFRTFGTLFIASSLAQVISNPLWGHMSDRSSRKTMVFTSVLALLMGLVAVYLSIFPFSDELVYGLIIFLVVSALSGLEVSRKTYLTDATPPDQRALYVATTNTLAGIASIVGLLFGVIAQFAGLTALFVIASVAIFVGIFYTSLLPEAEESVL